MKKMCVIVCITTLTFMIGVLLAHHTQDRGIISLRFSLSSKACVAPCWKDIVPGTTDLESLIPIINNVDGEVNIQNDLSGREYIYEWQYKDDFLLPRSKKAGWILTVFEKENRTVLRVLASVDVCVANVLNEYGYPINVDILQDDSGIHYSMLYPDDRLIFMLDDSDLSKIKGVVRTTKMEVQAETIFAERFSWQEVAHIFDGECVDNFSR